jgi:predicted SprT family Zn-dependent metalloprotease
MAFDALNVRFFESALQRPVITIMSTPTCYGHITRYEAWKDSEGGRREINLGAETLNRPIEEIAATLVHEMTHYYCYNNNIEGVSRGGYYHNKLFKEAAEAHGLLIEHHPVYGYTITNPAPDLVEFVKEQGWSTLDLHREEFNAATGTTVPPVLTPGKPTTIKPAKAPSSTRKYACPKCGQTIRATKAVNIICGDCNRTMEEA